MKTGLVLLDIAKAFDKVWHSGLLAKLLASNMEPKLIKLLTSYLERRTFRVRVQDNISDRYRIRAGVPQGSVLGPTLFNLFIADIPNTVNGVQLALYADDTAIYYSHRNINWIQSRLQTSLDDIEDWAANWRVKINPRKTQAILLGGRINPRPLHYEGTDINWSPTAKYLGVTLDRNLTWKSHIDSAIAKTLRATTAIRSLLIPRNQLHLANRRLLWAAALRPMLLYAAPALASAARCHINRLERVQNKTMRTITGAPWYVRNVQLRKDLKLQTIAEHLKDAVTATLDRIQVSDNPEVAGITNYNPYERRRHRGILGIQRD